MGATKRRFPGWSMLLFLLQTLFLISTVSAYGESLSWTTRAPLPSVISRASTAAINGKLYLFGGAAGNQASSAVSVYDPASDAWRPGPAPLGYPRFAAAAAAIGDTAYVIGGAAAFPPAPQQTILAYNTATGSSSEFALTTPRFLPGAAVLDGKIYIAGGTGQGVVLDSIECFDPATGVSSYRATMPAPRANAFVTALNGKIYIIGGGDSSSQPTTTVWSFDPATNSFDLNGAPIPRAVSGSSLVTANGRIYLVGGTTSSLPPTSWTGEIQMYDPVANAWSSVGVFPTARFAPVAGLINNTLYVVGGASGAPYPTTELALNEAASLLPLSPEPVVFHATSIGLPKTRNWLDAPGYFLYECYNEAGNYVDCDGTGEDGDIRAGRPWPEPRFSDSGVGTVTDNQTGLIWLKNANCFGENDWNSAMQTAGTLASGQCGLSDGSQAGSWRLPTVLEMERLVQASFPGTPDGPFDGLDFYYLSHRYWTSTSYAAGSDNAWQVDLQDSSFQPQGKSYSYYTTVWPVRDGAGTQVPKTGQSQSFAPGDDGALKPGVAWPAARFQDNGNGTLTDTLTGLIWLKNAGCFPGKTTWRGALNQANALSAGTCGLADGSLAGDWRLPSRRELVSLVNYGAASQPQWLQSNGFSSVQPEKYWSSDTAIEEYQVHMAYTVDLNDGSVNWDGKPYADEYGWAVRGGEFGVPVIASLPQALYFPGAAPGTSMSRSVSIANTAPAGSSRLQINRSVLYGADAPRFSIDPGDGTQGSCGSLTPIIPAGSSCSITVNFSSQSSGQATAYLGISGSDDKTPYLDIPLTANPLAVSASVSDGNGSIVSTNPAYAAAGGSASFTLVPNPGYQVSAAVSGSCPAGVMTGNSYRTGVLTTDCSVSFSFDAIVYPLNLFFQGPGAGAVSAQPSPPGYSCSGNCTQSFIATTQVTLTPAAGSGSKFAGWSGCDAVNGELCSVTMAGVRYVTASFTFLTPGPGGSGWSTKAPVPLGLSRAMSAVVDGKIYLLGGSWPATDQVQIYDPRYDAWSFGHPIPMPIFGGAAAAQGSTIFLAGGFDDPMNLQDGVYAYNTPDGSGGRIGSLITARARVNGAILDGKFYVVGGDGAEGKLDTMEVFDLNSRTSSQVRLPEPTRAAGVVAVAGRLYILAGGFDAQKCWSFDPNSGAFYPLASLPIPFEARTASYDSGHIYLVASWAYNGSNPVIDYDMAADRWQMVSGVPTERNVPMVEALDGVIYVMGGDYQGGHVNEAWSYRAAAGGGVPQWGMYQHDPQHTGKGSAAGPSTPNVKWSIPVPGGSPYSSFVAGTAVGADGTIYAAGSDGKAYALRPDGSVKYSYEGIGVCCSPPVIGPDGTIYFSGNQLYALNPDFTLKWIYGNGGTCCGSMIVGSDGTIYVANGALHAVNPANGIPRWVYWAGDGSVVLTAPSLSLDGSVLYLSTEKSLFALNPSDAGIRWQLPIFNIGFTAPVVGSDGTIYIPSQSSILAVDPQGSVLRQVQLPAGKQVSAMAFDAANQGGTLAATVYAYSLDPQWNYPIWGNGELTAFAVNAPGSGFAPLWTRSINGGYDEGAGAPDCKPIIDKRGVIYVGSVVYGSPVTPSGMHFYAFATDGTPIFDYYTPATQNSDPRLPAMDQNGTIYLSVGGTLKAFSGEGDWTVYSYYPGGPQYYLIDWLASQHAPVPSGSYLEIAGSKYYVLGSGTGSWNGEGYSGATLQQCDQSNGTPLFNPDGSPLFADASRMTGLPIVLHSVWPVSAGLTLNPGGRDFGPLLADADSGNQLFNVVNSGGTTLQIYSASISGNDAGMFFLEPESCQSLTPTLAPGASCTMRVFFAPQGLGPKSATLRILASDGVTAAYAPLSGYGVTGYPLGIDYSGGGLGMVRINPATSGGECGGSCSQSFPADTVVTITAVSDYGSFFAGWSGCDQVQGEVCSVTLGSARSVGVAFESLANSGWYGQAPMPVAVSRAASAVVNGKLYVAGGLLQFPTQSENFTTQVQVYDPQADSWQAGVPLCSKVMGAASATLGNVLYVAGGFNTSMNPLASVLAYDTQTGSCSQVGTLAQPRSRVNAAILGNKLYIAGGDGSAGTLDSIEELDLATGVSSIRRYLPQPLSGAGIAAYQGKLYIFGGGSGGSAQAASYLYDPQSNGLSPLAPMPVAAQVGQSSQNGGKIYLVGRYVTGDGNLVQEYDPATDSWRVLTKVPTPRDVPQSALLNGTLYVTGGNGVTANEIYSLPYDNSWTVNSLVPVPNPMNVPEHSAIDWSASRHEMVTAGSYLWIAGSYYYTLASSKGSWNGSSYNTALLDRCDQATGAPLFDGSGYPLLADLSGMEGAPIELVGFQQPPGMYPLSVAFAGTGSGSVSGMVGPQYQSFSADFSSIYGAGAQVQLSASAGAGSVFSGWSGCDSVNGSVCTTTLTGAKSVRASFTNAAIGYTVTPEAGSNGSLTPGTPQTVSSGGTLSFTVTPDAGYHVVAVTGCGGTLTGNSYRTAAATGNCSISASFAKDDAAAICTTADMVWTSAGTEIRRDYNCASAELSASGFCYDFKTDQCSGYRRISGTDVDPGCYAECPGGSCVNITQQRQTCSSAPSLYPLILTVGGGSGVIHSDVLPDINCAGGSCSQSYVNGTVIKLTATPAAGYQSGSWSGCDSYAGNLCTVTMTQAKRVSLTYAVEGAPVFTQAAAMTTPRSYFSATRLLNGKVLVAGGIYNYNMLASAELYDPVSNSWSPAAPLASPRRGHVALLLPSGKVLVAGGGTASAEIYDPAANLWSSAGSLSGSRSGMSATLLANGQVLIAGGYDTVDPQRPILTRAEIYDPATNSWRAAGSLAVARAEHSATLLKNGKVLVAGGGVVNGPIAALVSAEIYDPVADSWSHAASLAHSRKGHTGTLLANGKVLVAGGFSESDPTATSELYDPASDSWSTGGGLIDGRLYHTATLLPSGKVFVAGGYGDFWLTNGSWTVSCAAEVYDPAGNSWSSVGSLATCRASHTATLMSDGSTLVAGGYGKYGDLSSVELYHQTETLYPLSVTLTGDGAGTVHSAPDTDLDCYSGVCSQFYPEGTLVTLTARADAGYVFSGWGGACTGTAPCQVALNSESSVQASFRAAGDISAPVVTGFVMPATAATLTVPVMSLSASDDVAVTGYLITESALPPKASQGGWSASLPASYTFLAPGNAYAYAWAKDAAGNVSAPRQAMVSITLADPELDALAPVITNFLVPSGSTLTVPLTLAVSDNVGVARYLVSESAQVPGVSDPRWSAVLPESYSFTGYGAKTLYAWAKDAAGNVSAGVVATCTLLDPALLLDTVLTGWPANPALSAPSSFSFIGSQAGASFECSLDGQGYFACTSPISFGALANGSHTLNVRSRDAAGNHDLTPAGYSWTVSVPMVQVQYNTYTNVDNAYSGISSGATLQVRGVEFKENLVFTRDVDVTLKGGYDALYLNNSGSSVIHGTLTVKGGKVAVENIVLK